jgi:anti-sigma factor RsiW
MEKNKSDKNNGCGEPEAIVSFIYGELAVAESTVLEEHLSFCDDCTAELADLSFARLDVYEWLSLIHI